MRQAEQVLFSGRVQGVGFRRRTERIAAGFAVRGHVRNLADGRVEVVVEGDADVVAAFLTALRAAFPGQIARAERRPHRPVDAVGFTIHCD